MENSDNEAKTKDKGLKKIDYYKVIMICFMAVISISIMYGVSVIKPKIGIAEEQVWEYKTVQFQPKEINKRTDSGASNFNTIDIPEETLNQMGQDGWELVTSHLEMETAFPNFGDSKYVTGLQPNVRPQMVILIFKRPVIRNK